MRSSKRKATAVCGVGGIALLSVIAANSAMAATAVNCNGATPNNAVAEEANGTQFYTKISNNTGGWSYCGTDITEEEISINLSGANNVETVFGNPKKGPYTGPQVQFIGEDANGNTRLDGSNGNATIKSADSNVNLKWIEFSFVNGELFGDFEFSFNLDDDTQKVTVTTYGASGFQNGEWDQFMKSSSGTDSFFVFASLGDSFSKVKIAGNSLVSAAGLTNIDQTKNFAVSGCDQQGCFDNEVPIPGAVWLFGSGLLGLAGVSRRRKA